MKYVLDLPPQGMPGLIRSVLLISFIIAILGSCQKEKETEYEYFVSSELKVSYNKSFIDNAIDIAASTFPEVVDFKPFVASDQDVYRLVFRTTVDGEKINASGLVCVPKTPGEYPILCFQNGTNTVNANAPGNFYLNPAYQMIELVASMGFVVIIPDYPGVGESSDIPHPYLIKDLTTRSTADMLRAVLEYDEFSGISVSNEIYLMGYSQGGWATLALHKSLELDHADELNLKGSVCGSGSYDLTSMFRNMVSANTYSMPVYSGYVLNAYSEYHQFTNPVSDIFNEPYASRLANLYNGMLSTGEINSQLTTSIPSLYTAGFLSGFETAPEFASVRTALENNSIKAWNTKTPLYFLHGGSDSSVYTSQTDSIYNRMMQSGTSPQVCKKEILPGLDHGDAMVPALVKGLQFILDLP